jgi:chromosome segregation ATPase
MSALQGLQRKVFSQFVETLQGKVGAIKISALKDGIKKTPENLKHLVEKNALKYEARRTIIHAMNAILDQAIDFYEKLDTRDEKFIRFLNKHKTEMLAFAKRMLPLMKKIETPNSPAEKIKTLKKDITNVTEEKNKVEEKIKARNTEEETLTKNFIELMKAKAHTPETSEKYHFQIANLNERENELNTELQTLDEKLKNLKAELEKLEPKPQNPQNTQEKETPTFRK